MVSFAVGSWVGFLICLAVFQGFPTAALGFAIVATLAALVSLFME